MTSPFSFLPAWHAAGAPTAFEFDSPLESSRRVGSGTVAVPLVDLRLIRITGDDRVDFLHNLVSNDVKKLTEGALQWNSLNSPKGRMIASFLLWKERDQLMLALSADLHAQVLKKLSMYVLRSKTRVEDASAGFSPIGVAGGQAPALLGASGFELPAAPMAGMPAAAPRCLQLAPDLFIALPAAGQEAACWQALLDGGALAAGSAAWDLRLIRAGLPKVTGAVQEEFVAQMLNYDLIGGVSFTKGCYPGQEIVARTQYLGKLKKRMYRLRVDTSAPVAPGVDLYSQAFGDQSIGKVVLAAPHPAGGWECLAVVQTSGIDDGNVRVGTPDGALVEVLDLPYPLANA